MWRGNSGLHVQQTCWGQECWKMDICFTKWDGTKGPIFFLKIYFLSGPRWRRNRRDTFRWFDVTHSVFKCKYWPVSLIKLHTLIPLSGIMYILTIRAAYRSDDSAQICCISPRRMHTWCIHRQQIKYEQIGRKQSTWGEMVEFAFLSFFVSENSLCHLQGAGQHLKYVTRTALQMKQVAEPFQSQLFFFSSFLRKSDRVAASVQTSLLSLQEWLSTKCYRGWKEEYEPQSTPFYLNFSQKKANCISWHLHH